MIVDRSRGLRQILGESLPTLAGLLAWDVLVVLAYQLAHRPWMDQGALPYALIGSALALFLGVRNNTSFARWWEARTLWGSVVNSTRSLARQCGSLLGGARPDLVEATIAYAHALRCALSRVPVPTDRVEQLLTDKLRGAIRGRTNRPAAILHAIAAECAALEIEGCVLAAVDRTLSDLTAAQGGLERIRNTPLAIQFAVLPRLFTRLFCVLLPLSMVGELGWITPLGSTLAGFLLLALDDAGADLEDPFAASVHALPMAAMTTTIEIDCFQSIGRAAPAATAAVAGVLP